MGGARVMAMTTLQGSAGVWRDPFAVDAKAQLEVCERWALDRGHTVTRWVICCNQPAQKAAASLDGIDLVVAANRRLLEIAVADVEDFSAVCAAAGARVETANAPEPAYTEEQCREVYRSLQLNPGGTYR